MGDHDNAQSKSAPQAQPANTQQQPAPKAAPMKVFAGFTGLPGSTKTGSIETQEANALWLGLNFVSQVDADNNEAIPKQAISRGHTTLMTTYDAPLGSDGAGRGRIGARLDYAKDIAKSFSIAITGLPAHDVEKAKQTATQMIVGLTDRIGDVATISARVGDALSAQYGKPVTVAITENKRAVTDAGLRELSYTIRGPATLNLDIKAVAAAEKTIHTGSDTVDSDSLASKAEGHGGSKDITKVGTDVHTDVGAKHHQDSTVAGMSWKQTIANMVQEIETSFSHIDGTFTDNLTDKINKSQREYSSEHDVQHTTLLDKLNSHATASDKTKEGDEKEKNFWSWLKTGVDVVNQIPVPWALNPIWRVGIGVAKAASDGLAVDGTVHFKNRDVDAKSDGDDSSKYDNDDTRTKNSRTRTHFVDKRTIKQTVDAYLSALHTKFTNEVKSIAGSLGVYVAHQSSDDHGGVGTDTKIDHQHEAGGGGSVQTNVNHGKTTTLRYDVTSKETFLRPELVATVVGEMEVKE